jgi:branched-chain amino acid transport system substrate-binding protein
MSKLIAVLSLITLVMTACTAAPAADSTGAETSAGETIKIGYMGPLTGGAAFVGQEQKGFVEAAVQIFNEETGLNVEIVEGDTEINPDVGRVVAGRFAADADILVVVGPAGSQVCEATQPIFAEAGLAHITPSCTRTDLTAPGTETFFRPIPTDADQSKTDAAFMVDVLGIKSAFLVDDQTSYGTGLNEELEAELRARGVTEIQRASVSQEETDFSSIATSVVASGAELVFFANQVQSQLAALAMQLREQGYEGHYFLPDGGFQLDWVDAAGAAAEGAYVSFFAPDPKLVPEAQPYNEIYAANVSEDFGAFGGAAAFTTYIALQAVEQCADAGDLSRACMVAALDSMELDTSPLGIPVAFGDGNQLEGSKFFLFQIRDGQFALLQDGETVAAAR